MTSAPPPPAAPRRWLGLLARLPLPAFRWAGAGFGFILLLTARRRRQIALANLAACFPEKSRGWRYWTLWGVFRTFGQTFVDRVWLWHGAESLLSQRVRVTGEWSQLSETQPTIYFVPHFYGMDAGWARLTHAFAREWWTFYAPQKNHVLDDWIRNGRRRFGNPRLVSKRDGLRVLLKGLREGAALCFLPDMDMGPRDSVFAPFFGLQAATVTTMPRLAQAARAKVVPWVCRLVEGGYVLEIFPALSGYPSGDDGRDATIMNQWLETAIRTMPGQYHWLHRRFKTRPPGEPSLYR